MTRVLWKVITTAILLIIGFIFLAPLLWLMATSVKSEDEAYGEPDRWLPRLPDPPSSGAYSESDRPLLLGPLRLFGVNGEECEPAGDLPISQRWNALRQDGVTMRDVAHQTGLPYANVSYEFGPQRSTAVETKVVMSFPKEKLQGIQLDYQPDDSWHRLDFRLEYADGTGFQSIRSYPLAGIHSQSRQWRVSDHDDTPRIRDWVELEPCQVNPPRDLAPNEVRVVMSITRAGRADAAWSKIRYHYDRVFASIPFWRYFRTSVFLALTNALLMTFASALAAYSFARYSWPGRDTCFIVLLATVLFPPQVTLVPRFLIWQHLGAYDTLFPLWLPAAFGNAFFIFLLREALQSVPRELEDAARVDGCGPFGVFIHAVMPQLAPSLAAIATFSFLASWNDFLGPLLFLADQRLYSLSFGTYALAVYSANEPSLTSASAVLLALPPLLCFLLLHRYTTRLSVTPAVKG
jgi:multiple sugar transport system permease protein